MAVRFISCDPNEPGRDDTALVDVIKKYGPWAKLSDRAYAVETSVSPATIMERLKKYTDPYDVVCVVTLTAPYCVHGHEDLDDWLSRKLKKPFQNPI
jgi:hypothetical protein